MSTKIIQKPFSIEAWKNGAKVETRDGLPVRILCTDMKSNFNIVGLEEQDGMENVSEWLANGRYLHGDKDNEHDLVIVEEVEEPERWAEDETAIDEGWYIDGNCRISQDLYHLNFKCNFNVFATEKLAKSALAMARISQLIAHDERFGGVIMDVEWQDTFKKKYIIVRFGNAIKTDSCYTMIYSFLAFHTAEQRDLFLAENEQLVKDYLMID